MKKQLEVRYGFKFEVRATDDEEGIVKGYASIFDKLVPSYKEKVSRGAFTKTLNETKGKVSILYLHNPYEWLGMGVTAKEDSKGLLTESQLDLNVQRAKETFSLLKLSQVAGSPAGMSIGFVARKEKVDEKGIRILLEVEMPEYSFTPPRFQAAPTANIVNTRSILSIADEVSQLDDNDFNALLKAVESRNTLEAANVFEPEASFHSMNKSLKNIIKELSIN